MKVSYAQLLELFECGDTQVLCRIKVKPRCVEYYYGQPTACATHRWMQAEHWALFDKGMKQVLTDHKNSLRDEKWEAHFQLNALIRVSVSKSRVDVEVLRRCIDDRQLEEIDIRHALDCTIMYEDVRESKEISKKAKSKRVFQDMEYEPQYVSNQAAPTSRESTASPLVYIPYTPSSKADSSHSSNEANSIAEVTVENFEDPVPEPYSPKPLGNASPEETVHPLEVPTYNPMRIADIKEQKRYSKKSTHRDGKRKDKSSSHRRENRTDNSELKEENKKTSSRPSNDKDENKHKKYKHARKSEKISAFTDEKKLSLKNTPSLPLNNDEKPVSLKKASAETSSAASSDAELDRPSKRSRLIEEKSVDSRNVNSNSTPPRKHSHKCKQIELFGSDDDELI